MTKSNSPCILYVGTFPPRECGIATFTQDLTDAIDKEFYPDIKSKILAINDSSTTIYNYPRKVIKNISDEDLEDYLNRANEINKTPQIKLVNIQHEYGIYGGEWGNYLLPFLELLKKPVIITMHTVLPNPSEYVSKLTRSISERAEGIIVMTKTMANLLHEVYGVKKSKINIVPHGVHHIPYPSKTKAKKGLNLSGRTVLSTFGMLNRDKGLEYAIEALPEVVRDHPDVLYLILGATHPNVVRQEGEVYRNKLERLVVKHKLQDYVKFYNKYLTLDELIEFLRATDIYVSPTLNPQQAVSGTISYALSCACPIVATENQYAKDVVNHERGKLVKFRNSEEIKKALLEILNDKKKRKEMGKNGYFYSRSMTWQNVALSYFKIFNNFAKIMPRVKGKLPPIKLDYLKVLTTKFGMIQFANHTKPDPHSGYHLDDNARALLGMVKLYDRKKSDKAFNLINIYLKFIKFSQRGNGRFRDFVAYNKKFIDEKESEDSYGRAIWALGVTIASKNLDENFKLLSNKIFKKAIPWARELKSLRAVAFTIIGLTHVLTTEEHKENKDLANLLKRLCDKLVRAYAKRANEPGNDKWLWFEDCLTYSNYKLPEALFRAAKTTGDPEYLATARAAMEFLNQITFENKEYFSPIGQDGWYFRNGERAYFDQQPEDASSAVEALMVAYEVTKKKEYADLAKIAFWWFLGKNHLGQMVYDEATGGSYDGLGRNSLNFNQGAESTISYFLARLAIEKV